MELKIRHRFFRLTTVTLNFMTTLCYKYSSTHVELVMWHSLTSLVTNNLHSKEDVTLIRVRRRVRYTFKFVFEVHMKTQACGIICTTIGTKAARVFRLGVLKVGFGNSPSFQGQWGVEVCTSNPDFEVWRAGLYKNKQAKVLRFFYQNGRWFSQSFKISLRAFLTKNAGFFKLERHHRSSKFPASFGSLHAHNNNKYNIIHTK